MSAPPTSDDKLVVEYWVQEIQALNTQIHTYLRQTPATMQLIVGTVAAVAASSANIFANTALRNLILIFAPLVLALAIVYHCNIANEVAALAEVRDRLSKRVNERLGETVFVSGALSDAVLRGATGTAAAFVLVAVMLLAVMGIGVWMLWGTPWIWLEMGSILLATGSSLIALVMIPYTRRQANQALDTLMAGVETPRLPRRDGRLAFFKRRR
jgi:hypothetical protein